MIIRWTDKVIQKGGAREEQKFPKFRIRILWFLIIPIYYSKITLQTVVK